MLAQKVEYGESLTKRCLVEGPEVLSDEELLSIAVGTNNANVAKNIMSTCNQYGGLLSLCHLNKKELVRISGIGEKKACQIISMAEIAKRLAKAKRKELPALNSPQAVADYYMEDLRHLDREHVMLVMIDSKSQILKETIMSSGTVNASILSPREIFIEAMKYDAVNIILLHNHPSGDPTPSSEDISTTKRVKEAGLLVGIKLVDHLIIGDNRYTSLKEKGLL